MRFHPNQLPPPADSPVPASMRADHDPCALPEATVRAVLLEVARETVAECTAQAAPGHGVEYVEDAGGADCADAIECVPLGSVFDVDPGLAGHLHRTATDVHGDGSARPTGLPVVLRLVAALIVSRFDRDLLDVRLARARHDVAHLRLAQESNRTIGMAIGVLMTTQRCTAADAFELLRTASQAQNRTLRDIAADVPHTGAIPDDVGRVATRSGPVATRGLPEPPLSVGGRGRPGAGPASPTPAP